MKLELKHLAPYLPYGLKVLRPDGRTILELEAVCNGMLVFTENGLSENTYGDLYSSKPILRPLSDFDEIDNDFDLTTDFENAFNYVRGHIVFLLTSDKVYLKDIMTVTEWLFEHHFDVFGLIDAGLAIDINTIQPCT